MKCSKCLKETGIGSFDILTGRCASCNSKASVTRSSTESFLLVLATLCFLGAAIGFVGAVLEGTNLTWGIALSCLATGVIFSATAKILATVLAIAAKVEALLREMDRLTRE
jgi:hypothetical protein